METNARKSGPLGWAKWLVVPAIGLAGLFLLACGGDGDGKQDPTARTIYVQATEFDSTRTLSQDAFPQATRDAFPQYFGPATEPATSGGAGGYYLFMTSDTAWRIGSYVFLPSEAVVYQGDEVTLEFIGVRGGSHGNVLMDPNNNPVKDSNGSELRFDIKRGEVQKVTFTASKRGIYRVVCADHGPTMSMAIHVLPR
jgi:plastocyanin